MANKNDITSLRRLIDEGETFIAIIVLTLIVLSQIPTIKTYLTMIDFTSITLLEAIVTIVVSVMLYVACELAYKSKKQK